MNILGIDTGGTFTDFIYISGQSIQIHKILSTPLQPADAILAGMQEMGITPDKNLIIVHGSTVATNATLEGKGARTLYIGNSELTDLLKIGRQTRRELYQLQPDEESILPETSFASTTARLSSQGKETHILSKTDLQNLCAQVGKNQPEAIAINLLFSFLNPCHEQSLEQALSQYAPVSRSSFILPQLGEYERGIATWLNARLTPLVANYLQQLQQGTNPSPLAIMQSSGGTIDANQAQQRPVNLLLSGPAGGLAAARHLSKLTNHQQLITFDMGGTSTDVSLIDGELQLSSEGKIGPYPIAIPMVDVHTIGAGGGSIAYLDEGGLLQVGPVSAGAHPGPACYGKGGKQATVTDANTVLGKLRPDNFLGGKMSLDIAAAETAIQTLAEPLELSTAETARGILALANEHMVGALRTISVNKGYDPRDFQLCCFGGAGGLHVCKLAEQLLINQAIVPVHGGIFSAMGMLVAPKERLLTHTHQKNLEELTDQQIQQWLEGLSINGKKQLRQEHVAEADLGVQYSLDLRYQGQSFSLTIPWTNCRKSAELFHREHQKRYGHRLNAPVELFNIRCRVFSDGQPIDLPKLPPSTAQPTQHVPINNLREVPVYNRSQLGAGQKIVGPALICEQISTTYIEQHWICQVDDWGNLLLSQRP